MTTIIYIALIGLAVFFIHKFISKFKAPKIGALALFDGGVKVGKSAVSVSVAISTYKRNHRAWKVKSFFIKFINRFKKEEKQLLYPEEPMLYSNIPLATVPFIPLTDEHLLRKIRFNFKSVVFIDECSLVADSQLIKDKEINTSLLLFAKLFGHETHGGTLIYNSHNITDLHYALKRTTSQYFYIHHLSKYIPFFCLAYMREERYSEDGTSLNVYGEDVEDSMKKMLMRKSIFKKYDSFAFSYLTDHLPTDKESAIQYLKKKDCLKPNFITSFRPEIFSLPSREDLIKIKNLRMEVVNSNAEENS